MKIENANTFQFLRFPKIILRLSTALILGGFSPSLTRKIKNGNIIIPIPRAINDNSTTALNPKNNTTIRGPPAIIPTDLKPQQIP